MRWNAPVLGALLALSACSTSKPATAWSLVGVYDASALIQMGLVGKGKEASTGAQYVWVPSAGMAASCGPAKSPDGLGVFEAEAIANRLSPTLAIVLQRNGDGDAPMTPADVRVSVGMPNPKTEVMAPVYQLQPAVMPRYVSVSVEGDAEARYKQVVRNQLRMELCMEHKTGRGWIGGDRTELRQAFLLDPPQGRADRKYFGGQRDPVPALLGPPDACFQASSDQQQPAPQAGGRGNGSLNLVPSDVWGASLRTCGPDETGGSAFTGMKPIPLSLGQALLPVDRKSRAVWGNLVATLHAGGKDTDVTLDLTWQGKSLLHNAPLMNQPVDAKGNPDGPPGVTDLLERVPETYPLVGTSKDRNRYTVLLVPNWQIVEGLRRIDQKKPKVPRISPGDGIEDGVGWLLDHPGYLFVQLPPTGGAKATGPDGSATWLNVAEPLAGGPLGLMRWGYIPGMLAGRAPVVLPGFTQPTWNQEKLAHDTDMHAVFLGAFVVLLSLLFLGLQRLSDLWTHIPEERVDFWPTADAGKEEEEEDEGEAPAVPEGGGG